MGAVEKTASSLPNLNAGHGSMPETLICTNAARILNQSPAQSAHRFRGGSLNSRRDFLGRYLNAGALRGLGPAPTTVQPGLRPAAGGRVAFAQKRKMGVTDCLMARPVAQLCSMVLWLLIFLIAASAAAGPTRSVW